MFRLEVPDRTRYRSFYTRCRDENLGIHVRTVTDGDGAAIGSYTPSAAAEKNDLDTLLGLSERTASPDDTTAEQSHLQTQTDSPPFRQVIEELDEVIWISDPEKEQILYVNPAYEDIWGEPRETLFEAPLAFLDAIHPDDTERVRSALTRQSTGEYDEEYRLLRPDGTIRWIRDRAVSIENEDGAVYRVAGIAEDITERKERELELAQMSQTLEALTTSFPDPAFVIDEDGCYREVLVGAEVESLALRRA